jgi:hypothetical protein
MNFVYIDYLSNPVKFNTNLEGHNAKCNTQNFQLPSLQFTKVACNLFINGVSSLFSDRLCGLVVRVPGYRSRGPDSIPGAVRLYGTVSLNSINQLGFIAET